MTFVSCSYVRVSCFPLNRFLQPGAFTITALDPRTPSDVIYQRVYPPPSNSLILSTHLTSSPISHSHPTDPISILVQTPNLSHPSNSLANLLRPLTQLPHQTNTHGTAVNPTATPPKIAVAFRSPKLLNNGAVTNGKTPPRIFLQKLCAASAELAYRWYVSAK